MAAGAAMGLALGGAYLAGGLASDAQVAHAQAERLALAERAAVDSDLGTIATDGDSAQGRAQPNAGAAPMQRGASASINVGASMAALRAPATQTRELQCLTEAVYYEARGETSNGQAAVAQVVMNRVKSPSFPKSVCDVVFQGAGDGRGCQFSFACDGSTRAAREEDAWRRARRIASKALSGQVFAAVGDATHFHVAAIEPDWNGLIRVAQVGTHVFYRFGGHPAAAVLKKAANVTPALDAFSEPKSEPPPVILASATAPAPVKPEADAIKVETAAKGPAVQAPLQPAR